MIPDLLKRKESAFVLWRPGNTDSPPQLVIGIFRPGSPPSLAEERRILLRQSSDFPDLWDVPASECFLKDGTVYHYWFSVRDTNVYKKDHPVILCTDPTAGSVDWRLLAPETKTDGFTEEDRDPASVVKYVSGKLIPCDPCGTIPAPDTIELLKLPPNNRLVIYELPTSWARVSHLSDHEIDGGSFLDVLSLIDAETAPGNFSATKALHPGHSHLQELGINALELLPAADSCNRRQWGYATSNYFAPDFDLGISSVSQSPSACNDLTKLVAACHKNGIRFFTDMVMAFAKNPSYQNINYKDYHIQAGVGDPEEYVNGIHRDGFGGDLFKYAYETSSYDPVTGSSKPLYPARAFLFTHGAQWMERFHIDGIRMDSVNNVANWDFIQEFKDFSREYWQSRWSASGCTSEDIAQRFLVVGEELAMPMALIHENRLDGLWNEKFKQMLRHALCGRNADGESSFEWTVRKTIDCRLLGFTDGTQAVNYLTSHDVGGCGNERLYNYLQANGIANIEERAKLAFACLMTAVGIPMIFAGEEFLDQHDLPVTDAGKQIDPVNFDRLEEPWRKEIFEYVARLVKFRTSYDALAINDTQFIHSDFSEGKRVVVWHRGVPDSSSQVIVVANFSDYETPHAIDPSAEYIIPNWPQTPEGTQWREITQDRLVPENWVGREPIFPWEAKVYALY